MKLSKYIAITVLSLSLAISACGCDKDYTVGTPFENTDGSGNATATPGGEAVPTESTDKPEGSGDKTTPAPTKTDNDTNPGSDPTASPTGTEPTGEATTDIPTEAPTGEPATVTSAPISRDKFDRAEGKSIILICQYCFPVFFVTCRISPCIGCGRFAYF